MESELNPCQIEGLDANGTTENDVAQSLDQAEDAEETKRDRPEDKIDRPGERKSDNDGDIHSEQTSSIDEDAEQRSTQEETTCTQPAGGDVEGGTTGEQQGAKGTADSGPTAGGAQADSTKKTDTTRPSEKEGNRGKERRDYSADLPRSTARPKFHGRPTKKDIAEKFGGVATSGVRIQRPTSGGGANAVRNMLLEWCRAKTRGREGVDIQNFSSSWSDGLAFCALIVAFFPDAFDYDSLNSKNRRQNFTLAFNAAEKLADCPPLLDIEDLMHMKVPDSKCVYTYVQELYRSLVAKGLVKTKKA